MKLVFFIIGLIAVGTKLMNEERSEEFDTYAVRTICQRILNEQLDHLQKESQALEEVYGPTSDWVNGSNHLPDFLRSAINQHKEEALDKMIYLGQRVCVAKSLRIRATASGASSKHLRKVYLIDHQDELCESSKQAIACHFEPVECVIQELRQAKTDAEVDESIREFLEAKSSMSSGIPLVH